MRYLSSVAIALLFVFVSLTTKGVPAQIPSLPSAAGVASVSTILNPDGSVMPNISGSFDPRGYRMAYGPGGEPRFVTDAESNPLGCGDAWDTTFIPNGASNKVNAIVSDGAGNLYFAGSFTSVQGVPANGIAKWDGMAWTALGSGLNGTVNSIGILGNDVYVGGAFGLAGGNAAKNVAKWNGSSWSALGAGLGGGTHVVEAVVAFGGNVYFGGNFNIADGSPANGFVGWDGSSYFTLGPGLSGQVYTMAVSGGNLYAGGFVGIVGDLTTGGLLKWDGVSWSGFGLTASNTTVRSIGFRGTEIFVGGTISAPGVGGHIARYNGATWTSLGSFSNNPIVRAIAFLGTDIYAGGTFERTGGVGIGNGILKHDGSQWSALGSGTELGNHAVNAIYVSGNTLYLGGDFQLAGGIGARNLATLTNGTTWAAAFPGTGLDAAANAIAVSGTDVYVGGTFISAGPVTANRIARWNGITNTWSPLGIGISGSISAIAVAGGKVYAGGNFSTIGGISASNIAVWNGTNWSALGTGVNATVSVIIAQGDDIYVGGSFTTAGGVPANRVAKWNGTSWSGLNSSILPTTVTGMAFMGTDLYVGTGTTTAANPAYFSKYDGTNWTALGADLGDRGVSSLAVVGSDVYVAGGFTSAGAITVNRVAKWNGSSWSALGGGLPSATGQPGFIKLAVSGPDLIAIGDFTVAGGGPADRIAKWNGSSWAGLGTGLNANGSSVTSAGGDIFVGGSFTMAGCNASPYFARWRETLWTGSANTDWHTAANWGNSSVPPANASVTILSGDSSITSADVTANTLIVTGGRTLTVGAGRTLTVTGYLDLSNGFLAGPGTLVVNDLRLNTGSVTGLASITVGGNLYLNGGNISSAGPVTVTACRPGALVGGSGASFVQASLTRCVNSSGLYRFPVGTGAIYAPIELSAVVGSSTFTVEPKSGPYSGPASGLPANRLQRWWQLTNGGITQADLVFNYSDAEVVGTESRYRAYRIGGGPVAQLPSTINTATNRVTVAGVSAFSPWTLAEGTPVPLTMSGRATGASGRGAPRVIVTLTDDQGNTVYTVTNPFGYYRFMNVLTFRLYTVRVNSKKHTFPVPERLVEFDEFSPSVNFTSTDH